MKQPKILIPGEAGQFENYRAAVVTAGGVPVSGWEMRGCSGLLLCGGGDIEPWRYGQENSSSYDLEPERDAAELWLLEEFAAEKRPVLGVCRGMQLVNVYFGGTLAQHMEGHSRVNGADRLHQTRVSGGFLRELYGGGGIVNSAHHQSVDRAGSGIDVLQWAPDGAVEGICHRRLPVWGVQWHPERMRRQREKTADGGKVFSAFVEQCRQETEKIWKRA